MFYSGLYLFTLLIYHGEWGERFLVDCGGDTCVHIVNIVVVVASASAIDDVTNDVVFGVIATSDIDAVSSIHTWLLLWLLLLLLLLLMLP